MAQFTKRAIEDTFMKLLKEHSMDKITVKDIVEECGINRNTFYYYFADIYDLIDDIFEVETDRVIEHQDEFESWSEELRYVAHFVADNRAAIAHIYYSKSRDVLEKYLFTISELIIRRYVEREAENYNVSEENQNFICAFYGFSLVGMMLSWIKGNLRIDSEELLNNFSKILENSIKIVLQSSEDINESNK